MNHWLYSPTSPSDDRDRLFKELEAVESRFFLRHSQAEARDVQIENVRAQLGQRLPEATKVVLEEKLKALMSNTQVYEQFEAVKAERANLHQEYCTTYFQTEWQRAGHAKHTRARLNATSPSTQTAAEKMMELKESSSCAVEGAGDESSARDADHTGRKRSLEESNSSNAEVLEDQDYSSIRCNCKKSRCLKLYCECFASRRLCVDDCKCLDCANNMSHVREREEAIRAILERRPDAFHTKVFVATSANPAATAQVTATSAPVALAHARGCTCKKTRCTKKYCVCFNTNVKCGDWCRCVGCENGKVDFSSESTSAANSGETDKLSVLANITAAASPVGAL